MTKQIPSPGVLGALLASEREDERAKGVAHLRALLEAHKGVIVDMQRALGISERQARRWVDRAGLGDTAADLRLAAGLKDWRASDR